MSFPNTENTKVMLNGEPHLIRFENGMTGIGSRIFWIDNKKYCDGAITISDDIKDGGHFLYRMKWRNTPWDEIFYLIGESYNDRFLAATKDSEWQEPRLFSVPKQ